LGRFVDGQAGEEAQLHDPALLWIKARQGVEASASAISSKLRRSGTSIDSFRTSRGAPPPRFPRTWARVVHQDLAHDLAAQSEEVRAILPARVLLVHQAEIGFVPQVHAAERMSFRWPAKYGRAWRSRSA
jgi:hypothetical protein